MWLDALSGLTHVSVDALTFLHSKFILGIWNILGWTSYCRIEGDGNGTVCFYFREIHSTLGQAWFSVWYWYLPRGIGTPLCNDAHEIRRFAHALKVGVARQQGVVLTRLEMWRSKA